MIKKCMPEYYVKSIYDISFTKLMELGLKNLIIDIDNTLVPWGSRDSDQRSRELLSRLRAMGFNVCLLSNSSEERILNFRSDIDIEYFSKGGIKPMKAKFVGALSRLTNEADKTCIIGDQMFTDILGANRCNIHTILVDPFTEKEFFTTRLLRKLERKMKKSLKYNDELIFKQETAQ